eukprot:gene6030-6731_t
MVMPKKKSKRLTCAKKYKIQKKIREHHRKVKKEAKKSEKTKSRKDPGIPNSFPFKEKVLQELEERKQRALEEKERQKKQRFKEVNKKRKLELLQKDAEKRAKEFEKKQEQTEKQAEKILSKSAEYNGELMSAFCILENSLKTYYKEFKKVVDAADVLIEVLDARDPIGCRCPQVEEIVMNSGGNKRLVLLLNKIDLVPKEIVEKWLKYFRNELPTLAFKASTQSQKQRLGQSKVTVAAASQQMLSSTGCVGASTLLKLLGNYCRNKNIKTSISVGVIGFPNVGKSSVINSLKRCKACGVGSTPGFTKNMQEITLDKHIKLLDCPGIVMGTGSTDTQIILRNCVKIEQLDDVIMPVEAILRRCNKNQIMEKYCVAEYSNAEEFLGFLARRLGKLKKGGIPDTFAAAKSILQDWNSGKITFHTIPPERKVDENHETASIVQYWGAEFDMKAIEKEEQEDMKDLISAMSGSLVLNPGQAAMISEDESDTMNDSDAEYSSEDESHEIEEEDVMKEDEAVAQDVVIKIDKKTKVKKPLHKDEEMAEASNGNLQTNKANKKAYKQRKKLQKKKVSQIYLCFVSEEADHRRRYHRSKMNPKCAKCGKSVYPTEKLNCLDKVWHKGCFRCTDCNIALSMKTYKGYNKMPYCNTHYPTTKFTAVADTPENMRLAKNTAQQSNVVYHEKFESERGKFTAVDNDPETVRLKKTSKQISDVAYKGHVQQQGPAPSQQPASSAPRSPPAFAAPAPAAVAQPAAPVPVPSTAKSPRYQALYDYAAADEDEVSFNEGDAIINVEIIDDGWMTGTVERTGEHGMLPSNYVEKA